MYLYFFVEKCREVNPDENCDNENRDPWGLYGKSKVPQIKDFRDLDDWYFFIFLLNKFNKKIFIYFLFIYFW